MIERLLNDMKSFLDKKQRQPLEGAIYRKVKYIKNKIIFRDDVPAEVR